MPAGPAPLPQKGEGCCPQPKVHRHPSSAADSHTELQTFVHTTGQTKQAAHKIFVTHRPVKIKHL